MNKYFLLLFLFLFGCVNEQSVVIDEVPECELNDLECFFTNIMKGNPSTVEFKSETPVLNFVQLSHGYYNSMGCEENVCVFEVYYYESDIYLSNETMNILFKQNISEDEINSEIQIIKDSLKETWENNKVYCEMSKEEAQIYLQEYLDSINNTQISNNGIGSKRCNLILK
jgi:hypothetical protein